MGKVTGFMEWPRRLPERRDARERLGDHKEVYDEQSVEQMREQGGRCMDCGVPFCQQGCPHGWARWVFSQLDDGIRILLIDGF